MQDLARAVLEIVRLEHANLGALSASLKVLEKVGQPITEEMIQLLEGEDRELRTFVPLVLSELGGDAAGHALIAALNDPNQPENVKFNAIEALGKLQAVEAAEPLGQIAVKQAHRSASSLITVARSHSCSLTEYSRRTRAGVMC